MSAEQWRPIADRPGYEVSSEGRVRSWRKLGQRDSFSNSPRLLLSRANPRDGYLTVRLNANGAGSNLRLHRIVATAFLGELPEGLETRHLDGDKTNNAVSNLAYGTRDENRRDRIAHGTDHQLNKTHCRNGHPFDEVNTLINGSGHRRCRACGRASQAAYLRRKAVA